MNRNKNIDKVKQSREEDNSNNGKRKQQLKPSIKDYVVATRPWSLTVGVSSVLVGTALAFKATHQFNTTLFFITLLGTISVQCFGNLVNSYYDALNGLDRKESAADRTMFDLNLTPTHVVRMIYIFLVVSVGLAVSLLWILNTSFIMQHLLPFILIGLVLTVSYTASPVSLKYHGLGDIVIIICFGPLLVGGVYMIQSQLPVWSNILQLVWMSIPVALTIEAVLHVNNTRDIESDKKGGALTLSSTIGHTNSYYIYILLYLIAYGMIVMDSINENNVMVNMPLIVAPKLIKLFTQFKNKQWSELDAQTGQFSFFFGGLNAIGILLSSSQ